MSNHKCQENEWNTDKAYQTALNSSLALDSLVFRFGTLKAACSRIIQLPASHFWSIDPARCSQKRLFGASGMAYTRADLLICLPYPHMCASHPAANECLDVVLAVNARAAGELH